MRLAIDLGGTNIRIAQVAEGKCLNGIRLLVWLHKMLM